MEYGESNGHVILRPEMSRLRPQSRGLESVTAGLQSLRLTSRLKPWLRTIDGLGWLVAATHGYRYKQEN